jgi:membrane fusion protein, heavy metal efflux system
MTLPESKDKETAEKTETKEEKQEGVVKLTEEQVKSSEIIATEVMIDVVRESVSIQGKVIPRSGQQTGVFSPFPGRLIAPKHGLPIVGNFIKQGQLLASVEQEFPATERATINEKRIDYQSQIEQAQQEINQKTKDLERANILLQGGVIAKKQVQQAETDLSLARIKYQSAVRARKQYDALQSNVGFRTNPITAPISGTITAVTASPNQQIDTQRQLFEITNLGSVWVEAQVFEDYLASIRGKRTIEMTSRAAPGMTFTGRYVGLSQQVDPANKTIGVIFEVTNPHAILGVGMNLEIRLPAGTETSGTVVPASAVIEEQEHSVVFIEQSPGVYERREVKVGSRQGDRVLISEGLSAGEKVVSTGAQVLVTQLEEGEEEGEEKEEKEE